MAAVAAIAEDRVARVETLLDQAESLADPAAREVALDLVQALLDLYGAGLERIVEEVAERDTGELAAALAADGLVSHLLLLHGLHPVALEQRVRGALESVQPYLDSHGGGVELVSVEGGVVRLRLEGSCSGCPSSTVTLKSAIEDAIHAAAPDVAGIEADGVAPAREPQGLLHIEVPSQAPARRSWAHTDALTDLDPGATVVRDVEGEPLLFLRLDRRTYAYRPACPSCGASLGDAVLEGTQLECPGCAHRYDARRAGRCVDAPDLHLDPVPLLVDADGRLKVAVGTAAPA